MNLRRFLSSLTIMCSLNNSQNVNAGVHHPTQSPQPETQNESKMQKQTHLATTMYKENKINCDYRYFNLKIIFHEDRKKSCKASSAMEMSANKLSTQRKHMHAYTLEWKSSRQLARSLVRPLAYSLTHAVLLLQPLFDFNVFRLRIQLGI